MWLKEKVILKMIAFKKKNSINGFMYFLLLKRVKSLVSFLKKLPYLRRRKEKILNNE